MRGDGVKNSERCLQYYCARSNIPTSGRHRANRKTNRSIL
nr:MAG TPA: hypothetical protein [Caudoviricetes sp.]